MAGSGDLIVKLLLSSTGFDDGIKKSKRQVSEFEIAGQQMGKKLVSSFGQIAGAMMAIKGAGDAFKAVINSSQTIGDAFASTMSTAKTVTDNFIYALANADFSAWNGGLDNMIQRARDAYDAYDQLANTMMSASYVSATAGADYRTAMAGARNKNLGLSERREFLKQAKGEATKLQEAQQATYEDAVNALIAGISSKANLDKSMISFDVIDKALRTDATAGRKAARAEIEAMYAEYQEGLKRASQMKMEGSTTTYGFGGTASISYDRKALERAAQYEEQLLKDYADTIVQYQLLFRNSDEELAKDFQTATSAVAAQNQIAEWTNSINEVGTQLNNEAKTISVGTEKIRQANDELEQERQRTYGIGAPAADTTITMGVKLHNQDDSLFSRVGAKNRTEYKLVDPVADLPGKVGMIDTDKLTASVKIPEEMKPDRLAQTTEGLQLMTDTVGGLADAFGLLSGEESDAVSQILSFADACITAVSKIVELIAMISAEVAARKANASAAATEAGAKAMSAHASIPFAGIALGIAAVGAIVAAIKSVPKFAEGGIVTSATMGIFGEAGPEAVMPLDKLQDYVGTRETRVTGEIRGQGKDLVMIIDNYNKVRRVK